MSHLLAQINAVATAVIAVALSILLVAALPALWHLRKAYARLNALFDRVETDLKPIVRNAATISENLIEVTSTIRRDVGRVSATIDDANDRVQNALASAEQRVHELRALLDVAQDEAEDLFVSTASTVRGVQRGVQAFRDPRGTDLASDELDVAAAAADDLAIQEDGDGDDSITEPAAETRPAAPRVRPRPGRERRRA
jgi:uncharacterized protein YoxC